MSLLSVEFAIQMSDGKLLGKRTRRGGEKTFASHATASRYRDYKHPGGVIVMVQRNVIGGADLVPVKAEF